MAYSDHFQLFVSDTAWAGLTEQARKQGFIRATQRPRGTSAYMAKLLTANPTPEDWKDTRPDFLQEMDIESLEAGLTPTWDDGERKYNRFISFEEHQVDKAAGLARLLGVVKSNEYKPGPRNFLTKASLNSEFWEAIGLGWLTPVNQPVHYFRTKVRKPKTELAW